MMVVNDDCEWRCLRVTFLMMTGYLRQSLRQFNFNRECLVQTVKRCLFLPCFHPEFKVKLLNERMSLTFKRETGSRKVQHKK